MLLLLLAACMAPAAVGRRGGERAGGLGLRPPSRTKRVPGVH